MKNILKKIAPLVLLVSIWTAFGFQAVNNSGKSANKTATAGGTTTVDFKSGNIQTITMGAGNTTLAFSNIPNGEVYLFIVQDGTGSRLITWPSNAKFPAATAPTLSTAANKKDLIPMVCDKTNCYQSSAILLDVR